MRAGFERIGRGVTVGQAKRQCLDKIRYSSRTKARDAAARKANAHPEWEALHPYRCTLCGGHHLSRQNNGPAKPMPNIEHRNRAHKNSNIHSTAHNLEKAMKKPAKPAKKMPPNKPGKKC